MNKIHIKASVLALATVVGLASCDNMPFGYNDELIPQPVEQEGKTLSFLTNGLYPSLESSLSYTDARGAFEAETGQAIVYVRLTTPAPQDITADLELSSTETEVAAYNKSVNANFAAIPEGVLQLEKAQVVIKKGEITSEAVNVSYGDRSKLTNLSATDFIAFVRLKKSTDTAPISASADTYAIKLKVSRVYVKPIGEGSIDGLVFVDKAENPMTVTASAGSRTPEGVIDGRKADFYGGGAWQAPITNSMGQRIPGPFYVQINFARPINFAAYAIDLQNIRQDEQVKEIKLQISTDGGQTFVDLGNQQFDMTLGTEIDWETYSQPFLKKEQVVELYTPIQGVNAIRFVALSTLSPNQPYSIEELKIYEKR